MNEHEIERIALAANALRPDWPVASVRTLLSKPDMAGRPRRDVAVAIAWIACESNTATPARVREDGPWWRAAAVEATAPRHQPFDPATVCGVCGKHEDRCRAVPATLAGHEFLPTTAVRKRQAEPHDPAPHVAAARAALRPVTDEGTNA